MTWLRRIQLFALRRLSIRGFGHSEKFADEQRGGCCFLLDQPGTSGRSEFQYDDGSDLWNAVGGIFGRELHGRSLEFRRLGFDDFEYYPVVAPVPAAITCDWPTTATTTSLTVTWTTNVPTTGVLDWGAYPGDSNIATDGIVSTSHTITFTGLSAEDVLHFDEGGCNVDANCVMDSTTVAETRSKKLPSEKIE